MPTANTKRTRRLCVCKICGYPWHAHAKAKEPHRCPDCGSTAWKEGHKRRPTNPELRAKWDAEHPS